MYLTEKYKKKIWKFSHVAGWTVVFVLAVNMIRQWVADVCLIPSISMERTIMAGDRIVVLKTEKEDYSRNDLIIFNHPDDNGLQLVKRCIGLPGDTVILREGVVHVNGKPVVDPPSVRAPQTDYPLDFPLQSLAWTANDYGPVVTPAKQLYVVLDSVSMNLYRNVIRLENGDTPDTGGDYMFQTDCYFVLGDNRSCSVDSRHWGFVPKELIVGKAYMVCFSIDSDVKRIRWERFGKLLK